MTNDKVRADAMARLRAVAEQVGLTPLEMGRPSRTTTVTDDAYIIRVGRTLAARMAS